MNPRLGDKYMQHLTYNVFGVLGNILINSQSDEELSWLIQGKKSMRQCR